MIQLKRAALLTCLVLLSACSNLQPQAPKTAEQLLVLSAWQAKGKIGIRQQGKAQAANFDWRNKKKGYTIRISGALGIGSATLEKQADSIRLTTKDERHEAQTAEQLMQQTLGWNMPVSEFSFWIKGLSSPQSESQTQEMGEQGEILELVQSGWHIRFFKYERIKGYLVPRKIIAEQGDIKITLVNKTWKI